MAHTTPRMWVRVNKHPLIRSLTRFPLLLVTPSESMKAAAARAKTLWLAVTPMLTRGARVLGFLSRELGRWIRRLLVLAIFTLPIAVVSMALFDEGWGPGPADAAKTMWLALAFFAFGLAWLVIWLVFVACRALVRSDSLGSSRGPRLLAAVVVGGFCWNSLSATLGGLAGCVMHFGFAAPRDVARLAGNLVELPGRLEPSKPAPAIPETGMVVPSEIDGKFASSVLGHFLNAVDIRLAEFVKYAQAQLSWRALVVACAAWLALAFVLQALAAANTTDIIRRGARAVGGQVGQTLKSTLASRRAYRAVNWPNLGFTLIALAGMFLSLAAITSLPRLRENTKANDAVSAEQLRRELEGLKIPKDELASYYSEDIGRDLLAALDEQWSPGGTVGAAPREAAELTALAPKSLGGVTGTQATARSAPTKMPEQVQQSDSGSTSKKTDQPVTVSDSSASKSASSEALVEKTTDRDGDVATAKRHLKLANEAELVALRALDRLNFAGADQKKIDEAFSDVLEKRAAARNAGEALALARDRAELPGLIEEDRRALRSRWTEAYAEYRGARDFIVSDETSSALAAVSAYSLENIERRGSREEAQHFLFIRSWYDEKASSHRAALRRCSEGIQRFRTALLDWNAAVGSLLRNTAEAETVFESKLKLRGLRADVSFHFEVCAKPFSISVPSAPALGNSLGPLRFVAAWLLNAASVPLALIVGMLGFGLLGAMISTFVKERIEAVHKNEALHYEHVFVRDLAGVLLRGLSAAIVVFLAVQGGLAVLSGADSDPNPYVLLLACFVAAVFSERVWESAYAYLKRKLHEEAGEVNDQTIQTRPVPAAVGSPQGGAGAVDGPESREDAG
jgi:hypothetical protein